MVVLEGPQGVGKSRSLRILGGPYYMLATESFDSKDLLQSLHGALVVEIGELDSMSRSRIERAKSIISSPVDKFRGAYERNVREHPRRCIWVGTTNRGDYGNDETGMRRIWPVRVGDVLDLVGLERDRDQLLAEAIVRVRDGATWWITPTDETLAMQGDRQHEDAWAQTVRDWLVGKDEATSAEILTSALKFAVADIERTDQNRIGAIMKLAGWNRQTVRRPGLSKPLKAWVAP
jgi:predicted P-loop ATPase